MLGRLCLLEEMLVSPIRSNARTDTDCVLDGTKCQRSMRVAGGTSALSWELSPRLGGLQSTCKLMTSDPVVVGVQTQSKEPSQICVPSVTNV